MAERVIFSNDSVNIRRYASHHRDLVNSLTAYFSFDRASASPKFVGDSIEEVERTLASRLQELERSSAMTILAAVEAAFRIDFLLRCYLRKKDAVSRAFRSIYKTKKLKIAIEEDIFDIWKQHTIGATGVIGELRGAFRYRDWLAHGRYWEPKLGRIYDYLTVYELSENALKSFPLLVPE